MANTSRHITRVQRERLLSRATRLRSWCDTSRRQRPAFTANSARASRYRRVAGRLERYVAGVGRHESTLPLIERATRRHIGGQTSYAEWIEELRWSGLSARAGYTRLDQAQACKRRKNLSTAYPRISVPMTNCTKFNT